MASIQPSDLSEGKTKDRYLFQNLSTAFILRLLSVVT